MLTYPNYWQLVQLCCLFSGVQLGVLEQGSLGHGFGQQFHIEVRNIALVPLEIGVCFHKSVKLVTPGFPLKQYILAHLIQLLLDPLGQMIRQYALASPKLQVYNVVANELGSGCCLSQQMPLDVIIGHVLHLLLLGAANVLISPVPEAAQVEPYNLPNQLPQF